MESNRFTLSYLESLATGELAALADLYGIDIPPELERTIIIEELLDIKFRFELDEDLEEAVMLEPAHLPKQYNITFINTLIRDPLWVFVFWEVRAAEKEIHEKAADFGGYFLRAKGIHDDISFTIPVGILDNSWYLGFPPEGGRYFVEICAQRGDGDVILGTSKAFTLPPLFSRPQEGAIANPLLLLSGLGDLDIFQNIQFSKEKDQ